MEATQPKRVTTTGDVHVGPGFLFGAALTAGSDAASAVFRVGGAAGAIILTLKAPAGGSVLFTPSAKVAVQDLHVTVTGTSPELTVLL
jgi:hypothetical protein